MTPHEFKAWFDGFSESIEKTPTQKQWERIKTRVAEIDGSQVTERVYVDRYLPTWGYADRRSYPHWQPYFGTCSSTQAASSSAMQMNASSFEFNSILAMNSLGRAEGALN